MMILEKVQLQTRPWWVVLINNVSSWKTGRGNLVLSETGRTRFEIISSWAESRPEQTVQSTLLFDIGHHTPLRNRQNWWEPLPTTVRSIRPNNTVSKTVITVSTETVNLHEGRWLFRGCAIKALIYEKGRHSDTSFDFPWQKKPQRY